ncbi:hypothetical protein [Chryseobacterium sp.]|uniref:hypothetical protein n=1 Tax=Chryseobacterium sp. TaxID=1871047 RepID=UPI0025BB4E86|nr:hypothetical protein [Chryseobacterium sp.]MBV8325913.1 hypothetical protein [Chryseobacterium sp.]
MKMQWRLSFLVVISILTFLSFWNYSNRVYDWDMPGYIGCLYTSEFPDSPDKVRQLTFTSIQKEASAEDYKYLTGEAPFNLSRQYFEKNTQAFTEQLPYFQIKVGYIYMITFFYKLGFSSPMSVLLVSLISYFFSGLLLFYIFKILFPEKYVLTALVTIAVMLFPPMTYMARVPAPDMFIFPFLLIFIIGLFRQWTSWVMFLILLSITFIRPDYVTFTLTYLAAIFIFRYYKEKKTDVFLIPQGIAILLLYLFIIKFYHYPGWKDLFYDSFIERRPIISAKPVEVTLHDYLPILYVKIIYFKKVTLSVVLMTIFIFWRSKDAWVRMISVFFLLNVYIKFVFFPQSGALRFFFPLVFPLFIMVLYTFSPKYNGFKLKNIS